jgi:molybdate transport system substrate-binding protein
MSGSDAQQIRVAAASDLGPVLKRLVPDFEKDSGIKVDVVLGSSGSLFAQITQHAPYDLFLSADVDYAKKLEEAGLAVKGSLRHYAEGRLVLVVRQDVTSTDIPSILQSDLIRKIAIANPQHAPYGRAALGLLERYGIDQQVRSKLVLGENVAQAAQFVFSGNADAALIAASHAESLRPTHRIITLPDDSYPAIIQAGVLLGTSSKQADAKRFIEFLLSMRAQAIFAQAGFRPGADSAR